MQSSREYYINLNKSECAENPTKSRREILEKDEKDSINARSSNDFWSFNRRSSVQQDVGKTNEERVNKRKRF